VALTDFKRQTQKGIFWKWHSRIRFGLFDFPKDPHSRDARTWKANSRTQWGTLAPALMHEMLLMNAHNIRKWLIVGESTLNCILSPLSRPCFSCIAVKDHIAWYHRKLLSIWQLGSLSKQSVNKHSCRLKINLILHGNRLRDHTSTGLAIPHQPSNYST
jgi:hypothetical protein